MTEATESEYRQEQGDLISLLGVGESEVTVGKATSSPKSPGSVSPASIHLKKIKEEAWTNIQLFKIFEEIKQKLCY